MQKKEVRHMIYTVTFNPCLDYIVGVEDFQLGMTNRTCSEQMFAGGKGINVSIVLKNLGIESTALGFIAGFTGEEIRRKVEKMGITSEFIQLENGFSRINIKLKSIDGTEINGTGPSIGNEELERLLKKLDTLKKGDVLILAGSIPASLPDSIYSDIMERLERAFMNCEKLQQHMKFLLAKGSLYKVYNNNLLYHGCVPLNKDGTFKKVEIYGKRYKGKALYDILDNYVRKGFVAVDKAEREKGRDMMWYIWLNENSPLFGKDKMATFERYFLAEKETHKEVKNPYYDMLENEEVLDRILREFGLEPEGAHIINGHVPVKSKDGESPLKCGGKLLVIDGGFSRAYQKETGIAGYTLIYNSYGLILAAHDPFESTEAAIEKESDIHSESRMVKWVPERKCVGDTDIGRELKEKIKDLEKLLNAYYSGAIAEKFTR